MWNLLSFVTLTKDSPKAKIVGHGSVAGRGVAYFSLLVAGQTVPDLSGCESEIGTLLLVVPMG